LHCSHIFHAQRGNRGTAVGFKGQVIIIGSAAIVVFPLRVQRNILCRHFKRAVYSIASSFAVHPASEDLAGIGKGVRKHGYSCVFGIFGKRSRSRAAATVGVVGDGIGRIGDNNDLPGLPLRIYSDVGCNGNICIKFYAAAIRVGYSSL